MNSRQVLAPLFLLLISISQNSLAQFYSYYYDYSFNRTLVSHVNQDKAKVLEENISSRTVQVNSYKKNGSLDKSLISQRYFYNDSGQIIREEYYSNKGKLRVANTYTINGNGRVVKKETFHRKKTEPRFTWEIAYHNDSLISELHAYDKDHKPTWAYRFFYNENNQFTEQRAYKKGKLSSRIEYEYYADFSKKEVRYYKDSLELEKTFRYDCGIGNSLLTEKQKDTVTRCSHREELADGTIRTIEETRDPKGRIIRSVNDYNKEQKWSEYRSYDAKNRLVFTSRREVISEGKVKVNTKFYHRGRLNQENVSLESTDSFKFYQRSVYEKEQLKSEYYSSYTCFPKNN